MHSQNEWNQTDESLKAQGRPRHHLTIELTDPPASSQALKFVVGNVELEGVLSLKLGDPEGDGTLRPGNLVTATIECVMGVRHA